MYYNCTHNFRPYINYLQFQRFKLFTINSLAFLPGLLRHFALALALSSEATPPKGLIMHALDYMYALLYSV